MKNVRGLDHLANSKSERAIEKINVCYATGQRMPIVPVFNAGSVLSITLLLSLIFFFSGASAIIYQVAWQRILTTYYGVGAISIVLIVSVYMAGLGIGSLLGGFLAERVKNKISLYFMVELLIGCFGVISLPFLDFLGKEYCRKFLSSVFFMYVYFSVFPNFFYGHYSAFAHENIQSHGS